MTHAGAAGIPRVGAGVSGAIALLVVYALSLAPDVTFWDAGEFIAAAHSLGIPHPPGTPLYVLLLSAWTKLLPLPFAVATNLFSAAATALAAGVTARFVERATRSASMAFAAAMAAGAMSSVWLNATETEVYAASLALGVLMIAAADRAGREEHPRWMCLTAYLMVLAVPLHLSALVAAPAAIALASWAPPTIIWRRATALTGVFVFSMGVGRMSLWMVILGAVIVVISVFITSEASSVRMSDESSVGNRDASPVTHTHTAHVTHPHGARIKDAIALIAVATIAITAIAFLYLRAQFDPAINQGDPATLSGLADMVARRQYDVSPMWPRKAPVWIQIGNLAQYADWQAALSLGPTVMPSVLRSVVTVLFLVLGFQGAVAHRRADPRSWLAAAVLLASGAIGVLVYLNLHAGPSIGYGILPENAVREARERDYFFVFAFWAWGMWAGIGAVSVARRLGRPAWAGVLVACLPVVLNWRAVTRRVEPEQSMPRALAEATLESTPRNGVLFVMGDNDSYPLWYAQQVHRVRPDVSVITVPLLPTTWYRRQIAARFQLLDPDTIGRHAGNIEVAARIAAGARAIGRPVAAAMSMTPSERARVGASWTAAGVVYIEGPAGVDTVTSRRIAALVEQQVGPRAPRESIDPVHRYFRRVLECPRTLLETARGADSDRLDSACNYR